MNFLSQRFFRSFGVAAAIVLATVGAVVFATVTFTDFSASAQANVAPPDNVVAERVPSDTNPQGVVVDVTWDAVNNNDVDRYVVRYKEEGATEWRYQEVDESFGRQETPSTTIRSRNGIADRVSVRVFESNDVASRWSDAPLIWTKGVPTAVTAERTGSSIDAAWQYPNAERHEVVDYVVKYRPIGQGRLVDQVIVTDTTASITGLENELYEVSVRARFADGSKTEFSGWSEAPGGNTSVQVAPAAPAPSTTVPEQPEQDHSEHTDSEDTDSGHEHSEHGHGNPPAIDPTLTAEDFGGPNSLCEEGGWSHDRIGASGAYNEDRVPLEAHVWFFPTDRSEGGRDTGLSFGHAHMLTCVPFATNAGGEAVTTDTLDLDIESIIHFKDARDLSGGEMPIPDKSTKIYVREIEIRGLNDSGADVLVGEFFSDSRPACQRRGLGADSLDCEFFTVCDASVQDTCETISNIELDLANAYASDGFKQLRVAVVHEVEVDGEHVAAMRAIGREPFNLAIGNGRRQGVNANAEKNITESSGWLIEQDRDGAGGYATAGFTWASNGSDSRALSATEPVVPGQTVTIDARFEADPCGRLCAVKEMPITHWGVFLDPNFHDGDCRDESPDCVLHSNFGRGDRALATGTKTFKPGNLEITIPEDLEPGPHRLVLAVEQQMVSGLNYWDKNANRTNQRWDVPEEWSSTLTGLLHINIVVAPAN